MQESSEAERELYHKITMRIEAALLALEEEASRYRERGGVGRGGVGRDDEAHPGSFRQSRRKPSGGAGGGERKREKEREKDEEKGGREGGREGGRACMRACARVREEEASGCEGARKRESEGGSGREVGGSGGERASEGARECVWKSSKVKSTVGPKSQSALGPSRSQRLGRSARSGALQCSTERLNGQTL